VPTGTEKVMLDTGMEEGASKIKEMGLWPTQQEIERLLSQK